LARSAKVRGRKTMVRLTCTGNGACKGSLKLIARVVRKRASKGYGKHHRHHRRERARNIVIGRASFSLAGVPRDVANGV